MNSRNRKQAPKSGFEKDRSFNKSTPENKTRSSNKSFGNSRSADKDDRYSKARPGTNDERFSKPRSADKDDRYSKARPGAKDERFSKPRSADKDDRYSKARPGAKDERFSKPRSADKVERFGKSGPAAKDERAPKGRPAKGHTKGKKQRFSKDTVEKEDNVLLQDRTGKGFSSLPARYQKGIPSSKIKHNLKKTGQKETRYKKDGTFKREFEPEEIIPVKPSGAPKPGLHVRNKHRFAYDFEALLKIAPNLKPYLMINPRGEQTLDFANPKAIRIFNQALLRQDYAIKRFELPEGYLCPPIPGRADYIHYLADLLRETQGHIIPHGDGVRGLDIGTGASGIYPVIGSQEYGWDFVAVDTDKSAVQSVENMVSDNAALKGKVVCRLQKNDDCFFKNVVEADEHFDFSICNPPFYRSAAEARSANLKKNKNLKKTSHPRAQRNFAGQSHELWYPGGEMAFAKEMIAESKLFQKQIMWFTILISNKNHLKALNLALEHAGVKNSKTLSMSQGQKVSRVLAWTYLTPSEIQAWSKQRWPQKGPKLEKQNKKK